MKLFFILLFFFISTTVEAHTFYFSSYIGDDARTGKDAQNPSTPWKSLEKLNSYFPNLNPGDSILLKRGDEFFGTINISISGTQGLPITISAFGNGPKPIITGFTTINDWVTLGNGVWESVKPVTTSSFLNLVSIGPNVQPIGRYPNLNSLNKGYLKIRSHISKNSITDFSSNFTTDWIGGDIVVKTSQYTIDKAKITSTAGSEISFGKGLTYETPEGSGYFIQNHPATLDDIGEWYFNPKNKKLQIFYGKNSPPATKVASLKNLVTASNVSSITLDNIYFSGTNQNIIEIKGTGSGFIIQNCDISFSGISGIFSRGETNLIVEKCNVSNALNEGISVTDNSIVRECLLRNIGFIAGMTQNNAGISAINNSGNGSITENNVIKNTGYIGIKFGRINSLVKNNFIDSFCTIKQDGGAIYAQGKKNEDYSGTKIIDNIVLNGLGAPEGTRTRNNNSIGIYCDDFLNNIKIEGNTVVNCAVGIYLHNNKSIAVFNNTSYNNSRSQFQITSDKSDYLTEGLLIENNIFFSKLPNQLIFYFASLTNDFDKFGSTENN
ncbi:MAG: right-handed parallel beta-helix repeat-containing protein, partial [Ginsengibacter sp.]